MRQSHLKTLAAFRHGNVPMPGMDRFTPWKTLVGMVTTWINSVSRGMVHSLCLNAVLKLAKHQFFLH